MQIERVDGSRQINVKELQIEGEPYIHQTEIPGLLVIRRPLFRDSRGAFQERYRVPDIEGVLGRKVQLLQGQTSWSEPNVIRGIHAEPQDKIVTPKGKMVAVLVDLRQESPTFLKWVMFNFDGGQTDPRTTLFIPEGLANSLCVDGQEVVEYDYAVSKTYDPKTAGMGVRFDDPDLAIPWPVEDPIVSDRDRNLKTLQELFPEKFPNG